MADYERFWNQKDLSDVIVVIFEEYGGSREVPRDRPISAHKVVLAANSEVLRAQVLQKAKSYHILTWRCLCASIRPYWSTQVVKWGPAVRAHAEAGTDVPQLRMEVPAGQLDVGEWLLKAMYQREPDAAGMSQPVLLQLLVLADRYAVPKVLTAVSKRLMQLTATDLEWSMVQTVYELPALFSGIDSFSQIFAVAKQKLETELGDLELVWADSTGQRQQMLLGLPYQVLCELLRSPYTKVTSKNTIAHSIIKWSEQNHPERQQLQELVDLVRLAHCTPAYIATVISASSWFTACLEPEEVQFAAFCCIIGREQARAIKSQGHSILSRYPAWTADQRPESAAQNIGFDHTISLEGVKALFDKLPQQSSAFASIRLGTMTWQGFTFVVDLALSKKPNCGLNWTRLFRSGYCLYFSLGLQEEADVLAAVTYTWTTTHPEPIPHGTRAQRRRTPKTRLQVWGADNASSQHHNHDDLPGSTAPRTCHLVSTSKGGGELQTIFRKDGHPLDEGRSGTAGNSDWSALEASLRDWPMSVC